MTALSAHADIAMKNGELVLYGVEASTTIYMGSLVGINATGWIEPAAANLASQTFAGIAADGTLATSTTAGAIKLLVWRKGAFELPVTGIDQAHVGAKVYVTDSGLLTVTDPTSGVVVGRIIALSQNAETKAWVDITGYC